MQNRLFVLLGSVLGSVGVTSIAGCDQSAAPTYLVGGTVTGLEGTGLVLLDGAQQLAVSSDGAFHFVTRFAPGASYAVTVQVQPSMPGQVCTVTNGSGTVGTTDVTDIAVNCATITCTDVGSLATDVYARYFDVSGTTLFYELGDMYGTFKVADVSNPAAPSELGSLALDITSGCWYGGGVKLAPGGNFAYLYGGGCQGLPVIDVSNPASPTSVGIVTGPSGGSMDLTICGNMAYVATQSNGIAAYDLSSPGAPVFTDESIVSGMPYPYGVTCRTRDATYDDVYLGDGGTNMAPAGLHVFEYDKTAHTFRVRGSYTPDVHSWGGRGLAVDENLLYMAWGDTSQLAVFDLTNKDTISPPTLIAGGATGNNQLLAIGHYLIAGSGGIGIYDISTPTAPTLRTLVSQSAAVVGTASFTSGSSDYLAYSLNGDATLRICRLQLP